MAMKKQQVLKVEYFPINKLHSDPQNTKKHPPSQVAQIITSIEKFGFNDPIAVDDKWMIIEGHGRLLAAEQMKMQKVPVIRLLGMTDNQRRAYAIAHNKLTMNSDFDMEKLMEEMKKITDPELLEATGFSSDEITKQTLKFNIEDQLGDAKEELRGSLMLSPVLTGIDKVGPWEHYPLREDHMASIQPEYNVWIGLGYNDDTYNGHHLLNYGQGGVNSRGLDVKRALVGFYTHDDRFEVVWKELERITAKFMNAGVHSVIMPNFSMWGEDSKTVHLYNSYRCKYVARYMQEVGINVVPDLNWATMDSLEFTLLGIPTSIPSAAVQLQTMEVNTAGRANQTASTSQCLGEALSIIRPKSLLVYANDTGRVVAEKVCKRAKVKMIYVENRSTAIQRVFDKKRGGKRKSTN